MSGGSSENKRTTVMSAFERIMPAIEGIVRILRPLNSDERKKVIDGAMVVLRETPSGVTAAQSMSSGPSTDNLIMGRAQIWMKQNGISSEQLAEVFDWSGSEATVIASGVPGKSTAERTIKSYVLTGIAELLVAGEPNFKDKQARNLCEALGCYDATNHSKYMKDKGNYLVGDKDKGWKLTAPGLKYGASVVKEIAGAGTAE